MKRQLPTVLLGILIACGGSPAGAQQAPADKMVLNIASQPIGDALNDLARQTGLQVVLYSELGEGLQAPAVVGSYTAEAALQRLLANSNLHYEFLDHRTVTIRGPESAASKAGKPSANASASGTSPLRLAQADTQADTQDAQQPTNGGPRRATQEGTTADDNRLVLEEIIVTAQKRRENVMEVPISISVIGSEHLEQFHANQLFDFAKYVPGVLINNIGRPGLNTITLRGITPIGPNQTVGVYIDDAPVGGSSFFSLDSALTPDLLPYDIERIEVLRGPQGTLYGASGNAGLLKYVTRAPNLSDFELRAGTEVFDVASAGDVGWGGRLSLNAPLIDDKVALRASYAYQRTPGYVDNIALGTEDQNEFSQQSARVALLWQASEEVSLKLSSMWQAIDSDNNGLSLLNNPSRTELGDGPVWNNQLPEPFTRDMNYHTATLDWGLGWANFVSATSYSNTKTRLESDDTSFFGGIWGGLAASAGDFDLEKWTQEFRLASPGDTRVEWLLGAFYTDEDNLTAQLTNALTSAGEPVPGIDPFFVFDMLTQFREYALFGNLTWKFTERFDVTGGLRWARNDQDFHSIAAGFANDLFGTSGQRFGDSSESVVTYSLAPRLRLNPDTMLYARVANGYRPGGPNVAVPGARAQADSDLLTNYEVGVKTELLEHRIVVDAAVFRMDWEDIQITIMDPVTGFTFLDNAGEAWSQGVEVATLFMPVAGLRLGVNAAYTDTKLTELNPNARSVLARPGDGLPLVAKWSASATADYEFPLRTWRGRVGAGYRYVDDRLDSFDSNPVALLLDSYEALDLNAEVSAGNWTVRLFATNVTDEPGQLALSEPLDNPAVFQGVLVPPRTVGLGLDVKF